MILSSFFLIFKTISFAHGDDNFLKLHKIYPPFSTAQDISSFLVLLSSSCLRVRCVVESRNANAVFASERGGAVGQLSWGRHTFGLRDRPSELFFTISWSVLNEILQLKIEESSLQVEYLSFKKFSVFNYICCLVVTVSINTVAVRSIFVLRRRPCENGRMLGILKMKNDFDFFCFFGWFHFPIPSRFFPQWSVSHVLLDKSFNNFFSRTRFAPGNLLLIENLNVFSINFTSTKMSLTLYSTVQKYCEHAAEPTVSNF